MSKHEVKISVRNPLAQVMQTVSRLRRTVIIVNNFQLWGGRLRGRCSNSVDLCSQHVSGKLSVKTVLKSFAKPL